MCGWTHYCRFIVDNMSLHVCIFICRLQQEIDDAEKEYLAKQKEVHLYVYAFMYL